MGNAVAPRHQVLPGRGGRGGGWDLRAMPPRVGVRGGGGHATRQGLAGGEVCGVGPDAVDPVAARGGLQEGGEALVVEANAHRDLGRLTGGGLGQPDDGDPARRGASEQLRDPRLPGVPRRGAALRLRRGRVAVRARAGAVEDRDELRAGVAAGAGEQGSWGLAPGGGQVAGVGQPCRPLPRGAGGERSDRFDPEVVGCVEGGELAQKGAGEGARGRRWAGEGKDAELAERNDHRGAGKPGRPADDLVRRSQ
jgi:hypothetical protein